MNKCLCCDKNSIMLLLEDTYKCKDCNHIYRDFKGNGVQYHKDIYRKEGKHGKIKQNDITNNVICESFHNDRIPICKKRVNIIKKYLTKNDEALDIGGGAGTFANEIKSLIKDIEITELSQPCIDECIKNGYNTYSDDFLEINFIKKYDIVFAWHVLEHIKDINTFVERVKLIAKKYIVIEVPLLVALNGIGRKRNMPPPNKEFDGHYHYFSKNSFKKLFNDFKILYIEEGIQSPSLLAIMKVN